MMLCHTSIEARGLTSECQFSASRSGGAGGQNVNKVSTKVELRFNVTSSQLLSQSEKQTLIEKLSHRITLEGELIVVSQAERTQLRNKEACIKRFYTIIGQALKPRKARKPTRATRSSVEKRLERKRLRSDVKRLRGECGRMRES